MHRTINRASIPDALARAALEELRYEQASRARFAMTYCSQCGSEQGPGDSGVSHCEDHRLGKIVQPYGTGRRAVFPEGLPHLEVK